MDVMEMHELMGKQLIMLLDLENKKNYCTNKNLKETIDKYIESYSTIIKYNCEHTK